MSTPIRLISISMRNFLSYGNNITTVSLELDNPTLIIGRNMDSVINGQIDSNGAGKTTIANAVAWCLYDKPISKISQDGLINNINKKNLEVTCIFEKNGKYYRVTRFRKHKVYGGDGIFIEESDTLNFDPDIQLKQKNDKAENSIANSNAKLRAIIDMPYDIFTRIVIYSARQEPFFSLPTTATGNKSNQTDIMEELCGLTDLSRKADLLNENMKVNKKELEYLKKIQEEIDNQKSQYLTKINSIKSRIEQWDSIKETNLSKTRANISQLNTIDFDFQKECLAELSKIESTLIKSNNELSLVSVQRSNIKRDIDNVSRWEDEHNQKIADITAKLSKIDLVDYESQEKLLLELDTVSNKIKQDRDMMFTESAKKAANSNRMSAIAKELDHLTDNKCPYCLQDFVDVSAKKSLLAEENAELYRQNNSIEVTVKLIAKDIEADEKTVRGIKDSLKFNSISELTKHKNTYTNLTKELAMYNEQENPYANIDINELSKSLDNINKAIDSLDKSIAKANKKKSLLKDELVYDTEAKLLADWHKIETYKNELESLESSVNPHIDTLNDMSDMNFDEDNYKKINELEDMILHQSLMYKLLTKKDSFIRKSLLNKSLKFLNEQLKFYLDKLGMPHKVVFTQELTASISQFKNVLEYDNLSSGQQARVNLALSFSFRDVLQKRYGKISLCILDECLDIGLGTVGVQLAAKMIKAIAVKDKLSMFIISHKDEIYNLFPSVMEIELEKGFSTIVKAP